MPKEFGEKNNPHLTQSELSQPEISSLNSTQESLTSAPDQTVHLVQRYSQHLLGESQIDSIQKLTQKCIQDVLGVEHALLILLRKEDHPFSDSLTRVNNSSDLLVDQESLVFIVRGAHQPLAKIIATHKQNWSGFSEQDVFYLRMIGTTLALKLENLRLEENLQNQLQSSIQALAHTIETKDRYTGGHTKRVYLYSDAISEYLPLSEEERENIRLAGLLHDIGKIGVSDRILHKSSSLNDLEWLEMERHAEWGYDIVSRVQGLEPVAEILKHHHERWDGQGYPDQLKAEQIPLTSRVVSIADAFDAMTTERPYRKPMSAEAALETIAELSGTQFDPKIVEAFKKAFPRLRKLSSEF